MLTTTANDGTAIPLTDAQIGELRTALRGDLLLKDHADYEKVRRVWNGNVDRRPALIARCAGVADVQQGVSFARTYKLRLSSAAGHIARRVTERTTAVWCSICQP